MRWRWCDRYFPDYLPTRHCGAADISRSFAIGCAAPNLAIAPPRTTLADLLTLLSREDGLWQPPEHRHAATSHRYQSAASSLRRVIEYTLDDPQRTGRG